MHPTKPDSAEVILEIGAEGGSLKIQRFHASDWTWKFNLKIDESTLAEFLDEVDEVDLVKESPPVDTFAEAIQLMNKYPWRELELISVHPEYADFIRSEMKDHQMLERSKYMNAQGHLTSGVAGSITKKLNQEGYDVYYDHERTPEYTGTIAVSIGKELVREKEISQLDIAVVERKSRRAIALIEIEETTDNPKKLIGDIFAVLMGNSIHLPGREEEVAVGEWTTLIVIGKGAGHEFRDGYIQETAIDARSALGTVNAKIGKIVIESFSAAADLEMKLTDKIYEAIRRYETLKVS